MLRSLPGPVPRRVKESGTAAVGLFALVVVVVGVWMWMQRREESAPAASMVPVSAPLERVVASPPALAEGVGAGSDDAAVHLRHIRASLMRSSEALVEAQKGVRQVVPNLDRSFLALQVRRLEASDAVLGQARRDIEEALEDVEMLGTKLEGPRR